MFILPKQGSTKIFQDEVELVKLEIIIIKTESYHSCLVAKTTYRKAKGCLGHRFRLSNMASKSF